MIRRTRLALSAALILSCGFTAVPAIARSDGHHHARSHKAAAKSKKPKETTETGEGAKPTQVGSFGDWGAFVADTGDTKTCYVLAQPKTREPAKLKRDPAYVFISNRPGEHIHNEISITMGFPMKDGGEAEADVSGTTFELVAKGKNAWIKNPAEEGHFVAALRHNASLVVKAASARGKMTTDTYSLAGLRQALDKVVHECR
jgi:hypothetical protein